MFNFTEQERRAILFIITVALAGLGINFLKTINQNNKVTASIFQDENLGKININTADRELLMSVSGIGERLAQRIIEYRIINGNFKELNELKNIKGINDYRFEKIKDYLILR
jgi:competence ComEA-like helix-hairpin-helix protein